MLLQLMLIFLRMVIAAVLQIFLFYQIREPNSFYIFMPAVLLDLIQVSLQFLHLIIHVFVFMNCIFKTFLNLFNFSNKGGQTSILSMTCLNCNVMIKQ